MRKLRKIFESDTSTIKPDKTYKMMEAGDALLIEYSSMRNEWMNICKKFSLVPNKDTKIQGKDILAFLSDKKNGLKRPSAKEKAVISAKSNDENVSSDIDDMSDFALDSELKREKIQSLKLDNAKKKGEIMLKKDAIQFAKKLSALIEGKMSYLASDVPLLLDGKNLAQRTEYFEKYINNWRNELMEELRKID